MSFERLLQFDGKRVDLDLSATLILREIDFGHFETLKQSVWRLLILILGKFQHLKMYVRKIWMAENLHGAARLTISKKVVNLDLT